MSETQKEHVPVWFWVIAAISLLWNIIGGVIFLSEFLSLETMIEAMTEEQKTWARSTPNWIYFVFAISVSSGIAGSICLLIRKNISVLLFTVSVVSVLIQMGYTMLIAGGLRVMGPTGAVMPGLVITLSIAWLMFSWFAKGKRWLV